MTGSMETSSRNGKGFAMGIEPSASLPLQLSPERVWRTYLGGSLLDRLHGIPDRGDGHFPEEWIMSVVTARNAGREDIVEGPSRLVNRPGTTLKDMVDGDPCAMLGEEHIGKYGPTPGVLVKLIDSSERLTIQAHPDKARARELFQSDYCLACGKARWSSTTGSHWHGIQKNLS